MEDLMEKVLEHMLSSGAEYGDIRVHTVSGLSLNFSDRELKEFVPHTETGCAVRVLHRGVWGFSFTSSLRKDSLMRAARDAVSSARACTSIPHERETLAEVKVEVARTFMKPRKNPEDVSPEELLALMEHLDSQAREWGEVQNLALSYSHGISGMQFFSTEGARVRTRDVRTVIQALVSCRDAGRSSSYRMRVGGTAGFEILNHVSDELEEAVTRAVRLLRARATPGGRFPVIADPELTGVFVHEALGHAAEADAVVSGESILTGRLGEAVASEDVSIVDDPTIRGAFGSLRFDHEGVRASRKVIIEHGCLKGYIHSRSTAGALDMKPNGGARAEDHTVRPLVRMSNTLMLSGDWSLEEMMEEYPEVIYARGTRGGQVDTAKGTFQFNTQEAYMVKNGEIQHPLRDFSLSGETLRILKDITGVGRDSLLGSPGYCGKGQIVPVGDGGPHILIKEVLLGGA